MLRFYGFCLAALLAACPALASPAAPNCISSYLIDHTDEPDDHAILFTMRDRTVYRSKVIGGCPGLHLSTRGFTYAPDPGTDEICGNLFTIRVNDTGIVCEMGGFERLPPAPRRLP